MSATGPLRGDSRDPLEQAEGRALDRIQTLRERSSDPGGPAPAELRAVLQRTEAQLEAVREAATELGAVLPTRVEAAVARALSGSEAGTLHRRIDALQDVALDIAASVRGVAGDLRAERVGRIEDLELMIDLLRSGLGTVRDDVDLLTRRMLDGTTALRSMASSIERLADEVAHVSSLVDQPVRVSLERGAPATGEPLAAAMSDSPTAADEGSPGAPGAVQRTAAHSERAG